LLCRPPLPGHHAGPCGSPWVQTTCARTIRLSLFSTQVGEDGLAEVPEPAAVDAAAIRASALDDILRITGDGHRLGGRGRWLRVRHFVRLPPLLCDGVRCGDQGAGRPGKWRGCPGATDPYVPAQACGAFTPGPTSSALVWPADVAAGPANGCHPGHLAGSPDCIQMPPSGSTPDSAICAPGHQPAHKKHVVGATMTNDPG
jgi:hypothetical protein